jgi:hypothetical protein
MSTDKQWVMWDTITGDIAERGTEAWIRRCQDIEIDNARPGEVRCSLAIGTAAEARRDQKVIALRMSGNPPLDLTRS